MVQPLKLDGVRASDKRVHGVGVDRVVREVERLVPRERARPQSRSEREAAGDTDLGAVEPELAQVGSAAAEVGGEQPAQEHHTIVAQ